jgi:epsilon-lactone hydrolase
VISKQAQDFWTLLKSYPKQIEMPLAQAREADLHAEDFTSEPNGVVFSLASEVDGLWAEHPDAAPGRSILYFFGGGFALGTPGTRRKTAGHLAFAAKARVLVPNYRLAPEHPFPAALDDAVRAYQFLLDHGEPSKTIVSGDSAGGGLAVSTVIAVRDRHLPMCAGIVALSPRADLTCSGDSMTGRAAADIECTRPGLSEMAGWYMNGADPAQPLASPVLADLKGLPPLLCIAGGDEDLLDDSVAWCAMLAQPE